MQEGKKYFFGNHKLYRLKIEVSVRPNGIAVSYSNHLPGSGLDTNIIHEIIDMCCVRLKKRENETDFDEAEIFAELILTCGPFWYTKVIKLAHNFCA